MVNPEILKGQKLLGWVLILMGLALLILIGLAASLERRFSPSLLGAIGLWASRGQGNRSLVGVVAWLMLAGGYIFVLSARVEERLRDVGGEMEERINHLSRELASLGQRLGDRPGEGYPNTPPRTRPTSGPNP